MPLVEMAFILNELKSTREIKKEKFGNENLHHSHQQLHSACPTLAAMANRHSGKSMC